ncbi:hypothetical protein SELMODRAFT_233661 [Selaginella moellendorffii]|uniref:Enoyl reductase (ER) domain-containing protein n=1 Tax=Selaginella moellendorffii TaxID=88036 RepID=D8SCT2_SELML|nr:hypothetical protein SELMODRAFT_233661 [Selaginella moellendorffii]
MMHRAIQLLSYNREDPAAACRIGWVATPRAGSGQVVVKLLCRPVNPSDIMCLQGFYPTWKPISFPAVPGLEGMGIIHEVGENVVGLRVGQRVCPILEWSDPETWQEFLLCSADVTIPVPDSISNEVACQFFVNPFTGKEDLGWVLYALAEELEVPSGDYVIQSGASSVLGRMYIQYAHHKGIKTINLVRKNEQKEELFRLGADYVINFKEENVVKEILCASVKNRGTVIVYGTMNKAEVSVAGMDLLLREVSVKGFYLKRWIYKRSMHEFREIASTVMKLLEGKIMEPLVGEKFPLERYDDAIRRSLAKVRASRSLKLRSNAARI